MIEVETATERTVRLGGYELLEPLSDSFFGVRHRVRREEGGPVRAARVIADTAAGPIDGAAAALCNVQHPLLFSPIEIVRSARQLAVITVHVEGQTVRTLVKHAAEASESIPPVIGVRITLDLVEALQALASSAEAAEGSSLYGGLTPDSIHVGEDGVTRLLDPGVAAAAARSTRFALHPVLCAYTAPEHIDAGGDFTVRSDVFSLGVLLWEMLACRSLFESNDYEQVCERVLHAPIPRLQREHFLRGEPIAAALASVVAQALFRNPELRFQSYEHFASALRECSSIAEHEHVAAFMRGGVPEMTPDVPSVPAPKLAAEAARAQSGSETGRDESTFELLDGEIPIDDSEAAPATAARPSAAPVLAAPASVDHRAPALLPRAHSTHPCLARARCLRLRSSSSRPQRARPCLRRLRPTSRRSRCPCPRRARRSLRPKRPRRWRTRPALPWTPIPSRPWLTYWLGLVPAGSFRCSWRR
jgi:serine/threonine-protein kinase